MARGERHGGVARGQDDLVVVRARRHGHHGGVRRRRTSVAAHDDLAGAVGHAKVDEFGPACVCGSSGCLDSFASIHALLDQAVGGGPVGPVPGPARALERTGTVGLHDLAAAVDVGDPVAVQMARDVGRRVGETVAGLVAFANPVTGRGRGAPSPPSARTCSTRCAARSTAAHRPGWSPGSTSSSGRPATAPPCSARRSARPTGLRPRAPLRLSHPPHGDWDVKGTSVNR